ncbi:MAG: hypothetical protein ACPLQS_06720 [Desulfurococcaceae archaeon]
MKITVKGRNNYWRLTVHTWLLEVKDILEKEVGEEVEIEVIDGLSEDPELYVDGFLVGMGVPGEEGYLIEIVKKAYSMIKKQC